PDVASVALTDPTVDNGRIFVSAYGGEGQHFLHAINTADGTQLWTSEVPVSADWETVSQAAVDCGNGSHVYVLSQHGYVYGFHRSNGKLAWKTSVSPSSHFDDYFSQPTPWCPIVTPPIGPQLGKQWAQVWLLLSDGVTIDVGGWGIT